MPSPATGTYDANARVQLLADALKQDPNLVAKVWNRELRHGAQQVDDFAHFEGPENGGKPFAVKRDLSGVNAGDTVTFTVRSQPRGPGARGEQELTGRTSVINWATFACKVDIWRDAVELTQKQVKFMAVGGSVKQAVMKDLSKKLGRKRMNDMKMALKLLGNGNTVYPNGSKSFATLTALDTMSPAVLVNAKPQWQRAGGMPFSIGKNRHGSPVYSCMAYIPDVAMQAIRLSSSYESALVSAAARGDENPMYSGRLLDWQGIGLFEHISVDAEFDVLGDPLAPRATIGVGFGVDTALGSGDHAAGSLQLIADADDTLTRYFEFFAGYAYEWWEGQSAETAHAAFYAALAASTNYAWIVNPDGSVGFVEYLGAGNDGNRIKITKILNPDNTADASTLGSPVVGNLDCTGDAWGLNTAGTAYTRQAGGGGSGNTSADFVYTSEFDAGAYVIPANANGCPDISSLMMGGSTAVRCYATEDQMIHQERDYGFVKGGGYMTTYGQAPCIRTDRKSAGYVLLRHTGQHPGLEVPSL